MSKNSNEIIHAAADRIVARGEKPTQVAIRTELGGGSYSTISTAMRSWTPPPKELDIPRPVINAFKAVWEAAQGEASRHFEADREALLREQVDFTNWRQSLEDELDHQCAEVERCEVELRQVRQEVIVQNRTTAIAEEKLAATQKVNEQLRAKFQKVAQSLRTTREKHAACVGQINTLRDQLVKLQNETYPKGITENA